MVVPVPTPILLLGFLPSTLDFTFVYSPVKTESKSTRVSGLGVRDDPDLGRKLLEIEGRRKYRTPWVT